MLLRCVSIFDAAARLWGGREFVRFRWLLIVAACVPTAQAQYRFDSWTTDDGLPQNSVYSILQTRDGYLWFTTLDGLVRFDGAKFTVFNKSTSQNLPTTRFVHLFAEDDGTLWMGTDGHGLIRYRNREFQAFTVADGLPASYVHNIQKDVDGSLLIVTQSGLARFKEGRLTVERQRDLRDYRIYVAPSGARWELDASGLRNCRDGQITHYDLPFDANHISADRTFSSFLNVPMLEDRDGALWFAAAGNLYRLRDGAMTTFTATDGVPPSHVRSIAQDREGGIWFGTTRDGACRVQDNRFHCYKTDSGLSSNHIIAIFSDREGTLWFGTNEGGINRLTRRVVSPLSLADGLADKNVYPLLQTSAGEVWIGSFSALSHYKEGRITNYARREGLLYEIVQSLHQDRDGRLWIGSLGGIESLENGKFTDFTARLGLKIGEAAFWDIHQDRSGTLWFATSVGLVKFANGTATRYTTADGLPGNAAKIYEARDGSLWVGTDGGLAKAETGLSGGGPNGADTLRNSRFSVVFTEKDGLAGNHVRAIYEDADGVLWVGTYDSGLSRLANGTITNYTTREGLFSNGVFAILEDGRGDFWMSSNQGIYKVNKQQLNDFADGKIPAIVSIVFGKSDGMLNVECNGGRQPAGIKTQDGKLWFPTQDGVAIIDPEAVPFNPHPPPVVVENVKIDNVVSEPSASADGVPAFTISPQQNNLEINYTGLSFIKPEQMRFRYRLEGLNENWTEAGSRRAAYFPYLPPGKYTFRVIAANSDNVWNEQGAAVGIVVLPPFYRTWWFVTLAALGGAGLVWAAFRYRVAQLRRAQAAQEAFSRRLISSQEVERKRIAAELHDSLGQSLVIIRNWALLGSGQLAPQAPAREELDEISTTASRAITEVREIAYNLGPYHLDRLGLANTVKDMVNRVAQASKVRFTTDLEQLDGALSREAEMTLYRIAQEAINNLVKHSGATEARVEIRREADGVKLTVSDNGRGFDPQAAVSSADKAGFGLTGMAERIRLLDGAWAVRSAPERGTTIEVTLGGEGRR